MRIRLRAASFAAVIVVALVVTAAPGGASCAAPQPMAEALADAKATFVGTVTEVDHGGLVATFDVEEVWRGSVEQPAVVTGGASLAELEAARAQGQAIATSVDRTYQPGERYLVVAHGWAGGALLDNACSRTEIWTEELVAFRPAEVLQPTAAEGSAEDDGGAGATDETGSVSSDDDGDASGSRLVTGGLGVLLLAVGVGWWMARRRRQAAPSGHST